MLEQGRDQMGAGQVINGTDAWEVDYDLPTRPGPQPHQAPYHMLGAEPRN